MPSKARVTILSLHYPPEQTGNAPYVGSLARDLAAQNMEIRVLTAHPHYPEWSIRQGFGQWVRHEVNEGVSVSRLLHYVPQRPVAFKRLLSEFSFGLRLLFAPWGHPDVVLLVSPALIASAVAMLRARLSASKPPVVLWVQDLYSLGVSETGVGGGIVARLMRGIEAKTARAASTVVVVHSRFKAYVTEVLKVDPSRIEVVRNWTHLKPAPKPDVPAVRAKRGWADDVTVVLHAGNMGVKQGLENVVDAARLADEKVLPLKFVLLGHGNQRTWLEEYASGVERIQFLDPLVDDEFQATLASADILLVNEKLGVSEMAVPSKLTSYFLTGLPVVAATDPLGITSSELAAAAAGIVVDAGQPKGLVDACLALRNDPRSASRLGSSGQQYQRDELSQETAIDRFADLLRARVRGADS